MIYFDGEKYAGLLLAGVGAAVIVTATFIARARWTCDRLHSRSDSWPLRRSRWDLACTYAPVRR